MDSSSNLKSKSYLILNCFIADEEGYFSSILGKIEWKGKLFKLDPSDREVFVIDLPDYISMKHSRTVKIGRDIF